MYINIIKLTIFQLVHFGVHLGHTRKNTVFLSSWIFGGWRNDIFLINLLRTLFLFRNAYAPFVKAAMVRRPVWFVNVSRNFGDMVGRYAHICGEPYAALKWISGILTNIIDVMGWRLFLLRLVENPKYRWRHADKKALAAYLGFVGFRETLPALGFFPSIESHERALDEFANLEIPTIGIVDSNVPSWAVTLPIPGNDDSAVCVNFYSYIVCKSIMIGKLNIIRNWKSNLLEIDKKENFVKKFLNIHLFTKEFNVKKKKEFLEYIIPQFSNSKSIKFLSEQEKIMSDPMKKGSYSFWNNTIMFPVEDFEEEKKISGINFNDNLNLWNHR